MDQWISETMDQWINSASSPSKNACAGAMSTLRELFFTARTFASLKLLRLSCSDQPACLTEKSSMNSISGSLEFTLNATFIAPRNLTICSQLEIGRASCRERVEDWEREVSLGERSER